MAGSDVVSRYLCEVGIFWSCVLPFLLPVTRTGGTSLFHSGIRVHPTALLALGFSPGSAWGPTCCSLLLQCVPLLCCRA